MAAHTARAVLQIAESEQTSAALSTFWGARAGEIALMYSAGVTVTPPDTLTGTVTAEVYDGVNWSTLQNAGADVEIPAGKATVLPPFTAQDLRFVSDAAEAADRDIIVSIQEDMS